ncbi:ABC transporter substrate-binding protein [Bosea sp. (in: a-proteobacteria)]|uniref:ABC transporter substrate-binding protein n=1 Tax=Bosea sp. (in: a-proteobacteria) TaxID=1871050 RepID=UPI00262C46CE|nr:ABC transporter substrate-binding protein [Bosea sp. (in: a-proteobacteria)]MCO5089481.1 ABC transporter substrate-binding protein [Bosea sp. (in: a-proteobacteria)]
MLEKTVPCTAARASKPPSVWRAKKGISMKRAQSGLLTTKMSRRAALRAGIGGVIAAPFVLRAPDARSATSVVFGTYGGSYGEALKRIFFQPFAKETGIQVIQTAPADMAKLRAQVQSKSPEWDVIELIPSECVTAARMGLVMPLDFGKIDIPELSVPEAKQTHWLSTYNYTTGIGYNSAKFPAGKHPETWADFWDVQKFPGRRSLRSRPDNVLEIALLADGVAPSAMYPLDVPRAFKALDRIKPHIAKWADTAPQSIELIQTNDVDFTHTFNNRVFAAQSSGVPVAFNTEQLMMAFPAFALPTGAANAEAGMRLLGYMMKPDLQAELWKALRLIPVTKAASALIPEAERKAWFPDLTTGKHLALNAEWWGADGRLAEVTTQYRNWLLR